MQRQHLQMSFNGSIVSNHTVNSAHCFSYRLLVRVACMLISIEIGIGIPENPAMTMYGSRTPKIFSTGSIWSLLCDFRSDERTESYTPNWAERISAPPITKERPPCVSESRKGCVSGSSLIVSIRKHFSGFLMSSAKLGPLMSVSVLLLCKQNDKTNKKLQLEKVFNRVHSIFDWSDRWLHFISRRQLIAIVVGEDFLLDTLTDL